MRTLYPFQSWHWHCPQCELWPIPWPVSRYRARYVSMDKYWDFIYYNPSQRTHTFLL